MTHASAVRIVVNLVPEIEKKGAEAALIGYATDEDLPPAQLEKLAQVFNTLRTVSHIDNAEEGARGDTVALVDVPALVVSYATGAGHEKSAAKPVAFASHDPATVDLTRALKMDLRPLQKAASDASDMAESAFQMQVSRDEVASALLDLEIDLLDNMSKLACAIFDAAPRLEDQHFVRDISEFEEEAMHALPLFKGASIATTRRAQLVEAAGAYLEKFAAPHRTRLVRFAYDRELQKRAYDIPHEMGTKFAELAHVLSVYEVVKSAGTEEEALAAAMSALESPDADLNMSFAPSAAPGVDSAQADDTLGMLEDLHAKNLTTGTDQVKAGPSPTKSDDGPSSKSGDGDSRKGGEGLGSRAVGAVAAPFAAVGGAISGAASKADDMLHQIVTKERDNKPQRQADVSVDDIRRAMNVRRLIGTDPVLKEADPAAVLDIYNAIAARNPEIAGDTAALRLILREAVSYEGLTLDAQKTLTEIRRNSLQGQKESDDLSKKQYASGSANPLSIAKSKS